MHVATRMWQPPRLRGAQSNQAKCMHAASNLGKWEVLDEVLILIYERTRWSKSLSSLVSRCLPPRNNLRIIPLDSRWQKKDYAYVTQRDRGERCSERKKRNVRIIASRRRKISSVTSVDMLLRIAIFNITFRKANGTTWSLSLLLKMKELWRKIKCN